MARIPTYETRIGSLDVGNGVNLPELDQTYARSIQSFGAAISDLGTAFQKRQEQQQTFSAEQSWLQFQNQLKEQYAKDQVNMPASGMGWHDSWTPNTQGARGEFDVAADKWLSSVPAGLRDQYQQRVATLRSNWSLQAATDEVERGQAWFKTSIADATNQLETEIRRGGAVNFDELRDQGEKLILESGLAPATKDQLLRGWKATAAKARTLGIAQNDPQAALDEINAWLKPPAPGPEGKPPTDLTGAAASILRQEEGFAGKAGWDVNAFRAGYGSDTITTADGKVRHVQQGDVVSKADAERDLMRRLPDFINVAAEGVGSGFWKLPVNVQAALVSVAYNYGHVPKSVTAAAQSGDPVKIAAAVEGLGQNQGINNPERRRREAAIIRGGAISPLGDLTPDQIDALAGDVQGMVNQQRATENQIAAAGREDLVKTGDDLMRNMPDNPNYDPTKPTLTEQWLEENRDNLTPADRRRYIAALDKEGDDAIKTPPQELLRLDDLVQADPRAALKELRDQFAARQITRGTYDQLTGRAQAIINGEEKRPYIAQIRSYLSQQINPGSDGSSAEYQTALRQLFAFDDWAAKNKDATREEAQRYAADVAANTQKFRVMTLRETLPIPRFMDAANRMVIGPQQVQDAKSRTAEALAAKRITEAEAADEANKIRQWEALVNNPLAIKPF